MDKQQQVFSNFEVPDPVRIKKVIKLIDQNSSQIQGLDILECGMSNGGAVDLLKDKGANCYGVDFHPRKIESVNIKQADLNEGIPDFGLKFDVIFAGEVIEHLFDDGKFIAECRKALKPKGLLVITVPNLVFSANRIKMLFGQMPMFAYLPSHYHIYNKKAIEDLIRKKGFEIIKTVSSHVLFSTRRNILGKIFEIFGDLFPSIGAHLIVSARKI